MGTRVVSVFDNLVGVKLQDWAGVQSFIQVQRLIYYRGKVTEETAHFISSLPPITPAGEFAIGIRGHWRIENSLHYVKDVTFKEDASKIHTNQAPQNLSLIRNVAINLFREAGYTSMAQAIRLLANDIPRLWGIISA